MVNRFTADGVNEHSIEIKFNWVLYCINQEIANKETNQYQSNEEDLPTSLHLPYNLFQKQYEYGIP